jgi:hypothetical protein
MSGLNIYWMDANPYVDFISFVSIGRDWGGGGVTFHVVFSVFISLNKQTNKQSETIHTEI